MTYKDVFELIDKTCLNQTDIARWCGLSRAAIGKWKQRPQHHEIELKYEERIMFNLHQLEAIIDEMRNRSIY